MLALVAARGVFVCYAVLQTVNFSRLMLIFDFVGSAVCGVCIRVVCKEVVSECCERNCSECACRVCRRGCSSVFYAQLRVGEVNKTVGFAYCLYNTVDDGVHREICPCLVLVALRTLSVSRTRFAEPVVLCEIVACTVCAAGTSPRGAHCTTRP